MESPKTSTQSLGAEEKRGRLSVTFDPQEMGSSRRSTSVAPSYHSSRSEMTIIENHSEVPVLDGKAAIKRRRTQIVDLKISRWSCFLGFLFGSQITEREAIANVRVPEVEDEDEDSYRNTFDHTNCPYIKSVHVLPSEKAGTGKHQLARCTFDTGCLQGNIVSKDFARKLGFSPSDFKPLKPRERNGGTSATGHSHMPEGAIYLTWYHNTSPRLFRGMRFLVSPSQQVDIVVGARSLHKHKLLPEPNLGITTVTLSSDKEGDQLRSAKEKLSNDIATLEHERLRSSTTVESAAKLDAKIKKMRKSYKIKGLELELYEARKNLNRDPKNAVTKAVVDEIQSNLERAKRKPSSKDEKSATPQEAPGIKVSEPNGKIRTATGFSMASIGRSRVRN